MTKFDIVREKCEQAREKRALLLAEIDKLTQDADRLTSEAEKAAAAGDLNEYKAKKAEADSTAAALYVHRKQLSAIEKPISATEAREAWKEYAAKADKKLRKEWSEYQEQRAALLEQLKRCTSTMKSSLLARDAIAESANACEEKDFPLFTINLKDIANDRSYFVRAGLLSVEDNVKIGKLFLM